MLLVSDVQGIIRSHQSQIVASLKDPDIRSTPLHFPMSPTSSLLSRGLGTDPLQHGVLFPEPPAYREALPWRPFCAVRCVRGLGRCAIPCVVLCALLAVSGGKLDLLDEI